MLATGQRVRFCLGTPDVIKARFAIIGKGAYGEGTIEGEDDGVYFLSDIEVMRDEGTLDSRRTDPYGLDDWVYMAADELELAPLPIERSTTMGEVRAMLSKATAHIEHEGWSCCYDWQGLDHTTEFYGFLEINELRFIAVYHAEGGNEGHYIYVDMLSGCGNGKPFGVKGTSLFLCKTFMGRDEAQRLQNMVQILLSV